MLHHVRTFQFITQLSVVMSGSHTWNHTDFVRAMFSSSNPLCLFHQKCSVPLQIIRQKINHNTTPPYNWVCQFHLSVPDVATYQPPDHELVQPFHIHEAHGQQNTFPWVLDKLRSYHIYANVITQQECPASTQIKWNWGYKFTYVW